MYDDQDTEQVIKICLELAEKTAEYLQEEDRKMLEPWLAAARLRAGGEVRADSENTWPEWPFCRTVRIYGSDYAGPDEIVDTVRNWDAAMELAGRARGTPVAHSYWEELSDRLPAEWVDPVEWRLRNV